MARKGGNHELIKHQFTTKGKDPLVAKLSMRVTSPMLEQIQQQENWPEFVRTAIAKHLEQKSTQS